MTRFGNIQVELVVPVAEKIICSTISSLFISTSLTCTNKRKIGLGMALLSIATCVQFSLLVKMCNVQRVSFTSRTFCGNIKINWFEITLLSIQEELSRNLLTRKSCEFKFTWINIKFHYMLYSIPAANPCCFVFSVIRISYPMGCNINFSFAMSRPSKKRRTKILFMMRFYYVKKIPVRFRCCNPRKIRVRIIFKLFKKNSLWFQVIPWKRSSTSDRLL